MRDHINTLFSSQATKAWVAGLVTILAAYLVPIFEKWFVTVTPEQVSAWLGGQVPLAVASVLLGAVGVVWTYAVKNKPPVEIAPNTATIAKGRK
jgi:hypothetical protein